MIRRSAIEFSSQEPCWANALTLTPGEGTYFGFQLVCLHAAVSSAGYYTVDGSDPRRSRTRRLINYHEHIRVISPTTIRAVKYFRTVGEYGPVIKAHYRIRPIPSPKFTTTAAGLVAISNIPPDCEAYYTEDGCDPPGSWRATPYDNGGLPAGISAKVALAKSCFCGLDRSRQEPCHVLWGPVRSLDPAQGIRRRIMR